MMKPCDRASELTVETDPITSRVVWRLTSSGMNNSVCSYHLNTGFTADGRYLVLTRWSAEAASLLRADLRTGELSVVASVEATELHPAPIEEFAVIPGTNKVVAFSRGSLNVYDLATGECQVVVEKFPETNTVASIFCTRDGSAVGYVLSPNLTHPVRKSGIYGTEEWDAYIREFGGRPSSLHLVDLTTLEDRLIHSEPQALMTHVQPSPTDDDLWLINRDLPPLFGWMGDNGQTSRAWLMNPRDASFRPLPTRNENQFQMHTNWSADGRHVYYHGRDRQTGYPIGNDGGGHYIGAAETKAGGQVAWERIYPHFYYGHVSSHTAHNAIVIDSLVSPDLMLEIDFAAAAAPDAPAPMRMLGRHGSLVRYGAQTSHPHLQVSPDGRCIAYNRFDGSRTDVCILFL